MAGGQLKAEVGVQNLGIPTTHYLANTWIATARKQ